MKKYLANLKKELKRQGISSEDIDEILQDHQSMIEEAITEGFDEEKLDALFGDPKKLAEDLKVVQKEGVEIMEKTKTDGYELIQSFPLATDLKNVQIKLVSEDTNVEVYDGENIEVYFKNVDEPKDYEVEYKNGKLTLKKERSFKMFSIGRSTNKSVLIKLPKGVDLETFEFILVSGDTKINGLTTKELTLKTTSGDLEVDNIDAEKNHINTVSGDCKLNNIKGLEMDLNAVSGDFQVTKVTINGDVVMNTVSGDFKVTDSACKEATIKTVSGDLKGSEFYPDLVNLRSVSGDIKIENTDNLRPIEVGRKKSLSGDISIK